MPVFRPLTCSWPQLFSCPLTCSWPRLFRCNAALLEALATGAIPTTVPPPVPTLAIAAGSIQGPGHGPATWPANDHRQQPTEVPSTSWSPATASWTPYQSPRQRGRPDPSLGPPAAQAPPPPPRPPPVFTAHLCWLSALSPRLARILPRVCGHLLDLALAAGHIAATSHTAPTPAPLPPPPQLTAAWHALTTASAFCQRSSFAARQAEWDESLDVAGYWYQLLQPYARGLRQLHQPAVCSSGAVGAEAAAAAASPSSASTARSASSCGSSSLPACRQLSGSLGGGSSSSSSSSSVPAWRQVSCHIMVAFMEEVLSCMVEHLPLDQVCDCCCWGGGGRC